MPIFVKTCLRAEKSVAGQGVFALEDIPKGTIWWRSESEEPVVTPGEKNIAYTEESMKEFEVTHTFEEVYEMLHITQNYREGNVMIHLRDGKGHMNHSF